MGFVLLSLSLSFSMLCIFVKCLFVFFCLFFNHDIVGLFSTCDLNMFEYPSDVFCLFLIKIEFKMTLLYQHGVNFNVPMADWCCRFLFHVPLGLFFPWNHLYMFNLFVLFDDVRFYVCFMSWCCLLFKDDLFLSKHFFILIFSIDLFKSYQSIYFRGHDIFRLFVPYWFF